MLVADVKKSVNDLAAAVQNLPANDASEARTDFIKALPCLLMLRRTTFRMREGYRSEQCYSCTSRLP